MAQEITFPRLGWDMEEGIFGGWVVEEGSQIQEGDVIFEVESEKSTQEVEALDAGVLVISPACPAQGDIVGVGTILGYIVEKEEIDTFEIPETPFPQKDPGEQTREAVPSPATAPPEAAGSPHPGSPSRERVFISPIAKRLAEDLGIDYRQVPGTGRNNRITRKDVESFHAAVPAAAQTSGSISGPMSTARRITAEKMHQSSTATAPVTLFTEADVESLVELRTELKESASLIPTYDDLFIKLCAFALQKFPSINASISDNQIIQHGDINIGFAVDTGKSLLVPVVRNCDQKSLKQITTETSALVEKARSGKIETDEMKSGRFTITNLGMYDILAFTPIINLPECAILGLGQITRKFKPINENAASFQTTQSMILSLTFDHRLVDGAEAARFLKYLKSLIEKPLKLLVV